MNLLCHFMFLPNVHPLLPISSTAALQDPPAPMDSLEPTVVVPEEGQAYPVALPGDDGYVDPPPSPGDESSLQRLQKQFVTQS